MYCVHIYIVSCNIFFIILCIVSVCIFDFSILYIKYIFETVKIKQMLENILISIR